MMAPYRKAHIHLVRDPYLCIPSLEAQIGLFEYGGMHSLRTTPYGKFILRQQLDLDPECPAADFWVKWNLKINACTRMQVESLGASTYNSRPKGTWRSLPASLHKSVFDLAVQYGYERRPVC